MRFEMYCFGAVLIQELHGVYSKLHGVHPVGRCHWGKYERPALIYCRPVQRAQANIKESEHFRGNLCSTGSPFERVSIQYFSLHFHPLLTSYDRGHAVLRCANSLLENFGEELRSLVQLPVFLSATHESRQCLELLLHVGTSCVSTFVLCAFVAPGLLLLVF